MDFTTYKFYDDRGRRLSIFAKEEGSNLKIYVLTCSKKDRFSKREGKALMERYLSKSGEIDWNQSIKPLEFTVPFKEGKSKVAFLEFCKTNFKRENIIQLQIISIDIKSVSFSSSYGMFGNKATHILIKGFTQ